MKKYIVPEGKKLRLKDWDAGDTGDFSSKDREEAETKTRERLDELASLQTKLYAGAQKSLLIILQGMDTSGKDGTIKSVMSGVNPQGCRVSSFKAPTAWERAHDFLWRIHPETPAKGMIGIFNRSHYEDVLWPRVHDQISGEEAEKRAKHIRHFEKLLHHNGTTILKFFLHISKDEQKERLEKRIENPEKRWKFNPQDLAERRLWDKYRDAYEDAISATSTEDAPWIIVPSDHKWFRNFLIAKMIVDAMEKMDLKFPAGPKGLDFKKIKIPS